MIHIISQLNAVRRSTEQELEAIKRALKILQHKPGFDGPRILSAAARKRISNTQKARWAKWRKTPEGSLTSFRAFLGDARRELQGGS